MIIVTVKSVGGISVTPYSSLVDPKNMYAVAALGSDTRFFSDIWETHMGPIEIVVEETFAQVQALLDIQTVTSGRVKELWGLIDTAVAGSTTIATHDVLDPVTQLAVKLPKGAVVTTGMAFVKTTFVSATDAATIALGVETDSAAGLKAAIAISNGANPWDAGKTALIPVNTVATFLSGITAERKLQYVVAVEALTAGKMLVYLQYTIDPLA